MNDTIIEAYLCMGDYLPMNEEFTNSGKSKTFYKSHAPKDGKLESVTKKENTTTYSILHAHGPNANKHPTGGVSVDRNIDRIRNHYGHDFNHANGGNHTETKNGTTIETKTIPVVSQWGHQLHRTLINITKH